MLKAGKTQEITDQIAGSQIQIDALQEVRWKVYGLLKKDKYSIYYSCNPNTTGNVNRGGLSSTRGLGPTMTERGLEPIMTTRCQSISISFGMLPQTLIMSRLDQLSRFGARI
jgi:hypothetical protein